MKESTDREEEDKGEAVETFSTTLAAVTREMPPDMDVVRPGEAAPCAALRSPLHEAVWAEEWDRLRQLLAEGADVHARDCFARTPLHLAAEVGTPEILELLLQHGAAVDEQDGAGMTPLHLAVCCGALQNVACLLRHGADVNAADEAGNTPLHIALGDVPSPELPEMLPLLLEHGADVRACNRLGETVYARALFAGVARPVRRLLRQHGAVAGLLPLKLMLRQRTPFLLMSAGVLLLGLFLCYCAVVAFYFWFGMEPWVELLALISFYASHAALGCAGLALLVSGWRRRAEARAAIWMRRHVESAALALGGRRVRSKALMSWTLVGPWVRMLAGALMVALALCNIGVPELWEGRFCLFSAYTMPAFCLYLGPWLLHRGRAELRECGQWSGLA